jgi:hypothetical protein
VTSAVARRRLQSQLLDGPSPASPHEVVAHFGAMQAQDYLASLWAVGARLDSVVEADVERALAERTIVRCWPMRGTLHIVAAEDVRWMLSLLAPRVLARHRPRLEREFGIDGKTLSRCRTIAERALRGGNALTRPELYALFNEAGIRTDESSGLHILFALAHEQLLCFGARRGKQPTFVLLDEWLPPAAAKSREEALAELARRYFTSHGPATVADFCWWSGLTVKEAQEGIALAGLSESPRPARSKLSVHLLPAFDEYTVAYKERGAILDAAYAKRVNAGGGILNAVVVIDGIVAGTWKRFLRGAHRVEIALDLFRTTDAREKRAIARAASRYAKFLGREL